MQEFTSFFIILLAAVLFAQIFTRMKIPWVVALIVGGIIIGPHGLALFTPDDTIHFLAHIGLVFLMFMAGLESRLSSIQGIKKRIAILSLCIGFIPGAVGAGIVITFGYAPPVAILFGIIFMSSAIALLIPSLQAQNILGSQFGKIIMGSTIAIDALSLVLLSIFLQLTESYSIFSVILFYPLLLALLTGLVWAVPRIRWAVFTEYAEEQDLFEKELRLVILILMGLVVFFGIIGLHAIIAGFFAGLILSQSIQSRILKAKIHAISYGFFIPVFFVVVGASTDMSVFKNTFSIFSLVLVIVSGLMASKLFSGWLGGRLCGFTNKESVYLGIVSLPQLSTTLAVAFLGYGQGFIDQQLLTSIVILTVVTSIAAPVLISLFADYAQNQRIAVLNSEPHENAP